MKYSLGLTAVTMIALSGLYFAGCSDAGSGMGILDPYETGSPVPVGPGGGTATPTPTASPTQAIGQELFQDQLTNPICIESLPSMANLDSYTMQTNYWVLQYDKAGGAETKLVRIAADTEKGKSDSDNKSPHTMSIIDVDTNQEIILTDAVCMKSVSNPDIKEFKDKSREVFALQYNPTNSYLVVSDCVKTTGNGRIIMINPHEQDGKNDRVYAKVLYDTAKHPVAIAVDNKYIWWGECKIDASVMRMDYATNPDTINDYAWRTKVYTAGLQYPSNILSDGSNVYVADTGGNRVFIGRCFNQEREQEKSTAQVCQYATDANNGYYLLEAGFNQPYALAIMRNGKLLIADGCSNPMFDSGITPIGTNSGCLYVWDTKGMQERQADEKLDLNVTKLYEGLNNPMMLGITYDATTDYTSKYAQYADLIIPQYSTIKNSSNITIMRVNLAYRKSKLVKSKNFLMADKTTWVYLLSQYFSSDDTPASVPEDNDEDINMLFNEGILEPVNYTATIQTYNEDYPF